MTRGIGLQVRIGWNVLEVGGRAFAGEYRVTESGVSISGGPVLLAIDSEGRRSVLFPVAMLEPNEEDTRSAGVQVHTRNLIEQGVSNRFVALVCLRPKLTGVFVELVEDVLQRLTVHGGYAARVCIQALGEWRELLERTLASGMSADALVGLFGELWILRQLMRLNPEAMRKWVGPSGARHDFIGDAISLEVKTTASRRGRFIEVHGLEQLAPLPGASLYLAFLRVERVPAGGELVSQLASEIVGLGGDREFLEESLERLGYDESQLRPEKDAFIVTEERYYEVEGDFPRIVNSSFKSGFAPQGVIKVTYEVDLSQEPPLQLDATKSQAILAHLAGRGMVSA